MKIPGQARISILGLVFREDINKAHSQPEVQGRTYQSCNTPTNPLSRIKGR